MIVKSRTKKYSSKQYTYSHLRGKFNLPTFQRRLVWSTKQKEEFIDTLSLGFPFGSILVYQYPEKKEISLIDGLQRISTIQDYEKSPEKYIDLDDEAIQLIKLLVTNDSDKENEKLVNSLKKEIKDIFKNMLKEDNPKPFYLEDEIKTSENISRYFDSSFTRAIGELQHNIIEKKTNFLNVDNIEIPAVEFLGDVSELAKVFENLNKGGKKLTKYQVFAAQWYNDTIKLNDKKNNQKLLEAIINKYINLNENRDIKIEDFSADEMRELKTINLSELCYGIGKLILDVSPVFYSSKKYEQLEDLADELGYSTMGIIFGVDNKKLHTLKIQTDSVLNADLLEELIGKVLMIYSNINSHFEKYLKLMKIKIAYENKKISNFKFLSYFADLWANNFIITKDGQIKDNSTGQDKTYSNSLNNFIIYYLQDAAMNSWGNAGDSRLNSYYLDRSKKYSSRPSKENLEETLLFWWKERCSNPSLMFDDMSKLILTVYYNLIPSNGLLDGRDHDFEHIIVKSKVKDKYSKHKIPAGSLGNMMFLDSNVNRAKKDLNLYKLIASGENIKEEFNSVALYPEERIINDIEVELDNDTAESALRFISQRGNNIIKKLVEKLY
ncbi:MULTISPECIES: GmrSD restriction endonuclease domain-containing protein [Bacillus]|uniref:GmrSD restriction endonuclease domain-containing protein n=1 Tax=Bacillus cereus group TaxID=86661 RepID=UPI0005DDD8FB|nr:MULTISPECIES: DUF262 domain-containing protein [Bacillus cereus group]PGH92328.1 hypothetical protein CN900_13635 [Bacillus anthracis]CGG52266.1 Uncharacterized conserved protein [Streptococcus pneumoniae]MDA2088951.1 DUF262 domain-containing protein [Bacillus cereus]MDA2405092.1 DUF262 domain-containing protein [Bacillus cereus]MDA2423315.1 DUF262 domain-containing protein [Bacillus cereus]